MGPRRFWIIATFHAYFFVPKFWYSHYTYCSQENLAIFSKNVNYTKSSCIIFHIRMSKYSYCRYCLQKESTNFSLEVWEHFGLRVSRHFKPKSYTRKNINIHKNFWIIKIFKTNFLCQTVPIYLFYTLPKLRNAWRTQFCVIIIPKLFLT